MATGQLERELGAGSDLLTSAQARAAALARAAATCAGVCVPTRVWRRPDAVVAFTVPVIAGVSLAELRSARALSVGECVTVGVGVAKALAAVHGQRLAHGDVSPANVLVRGREVTLVDTMGALADERGTASFAAPERAHGATPAGDVFALGALLRFLVSDDGTPVIEAWTAPLLVERPESRPTAAHAAAALARCAEPTPLRAIESPVAAAMRAGGVARTLRRPADRWWHAERAAKRLAPIAGLVVIATWAGSALVPALEAAPVRSQLAERTQGVVAMPVLADSLADPVVAAERLTAARVDALATEDPIALAATTATGSSAASADGQTLALLRDGALTFDGLALESAVGRLVDTMPGGAVVEVTSELSAYSVGRLSEKTPVPATTAVATLKLALTQRGWRVVQILPPP